MLIRGDACTRIEIQEACEVRMHVFLIKRYPGWRHFPHCGKFNSCDKIHEVHQHPMFSAGFFFIPPKPVERVDEVDFAE